jgi:hypothetical protein
MSKPDERRPGVLDGAMASAGLGGMSGPAKVIVKLAIVGGAVYAIFVFVADFLSESPSSTAVFVFVFVGAYVGIAIALVAAVDWTIRQVRRRAD